jgi:hypothetical protein
MTSRKQISGIKCETKGRSDAPIADQLMEAVETSIEAEFMRVMHNYGVKTKEALPKGKMDVKVELTTTGVKITALWTSAKGN